MKLVVLKRQIITSERNFAFHSSIITAVAMLCFAQLCPQCSVVLCPINAIARSFSVDLNTFLNLMFYKSLCSFKWLILS